MNTRIFLHKDKVELEDVRFYRGVDPKTKQEVFYPSVTTVLSAWPKGFGYNTWLKSNGFDADLLLAKAAEKGTNIHEACEALLKGEKVSFYNEQEIDENMQQKVNYSWDEWKQISKFHEFVKETDLKMLSVPETTIVDNQIGVGGTLDIPCAVIGGQNCLLDIKTGNNLYQTHELQLAVYAKMWNNLNTENKVTRTGIIHLDAKTRTKKIDFEKIIFQGEGWQVKFIDDIEHNFNLFLDVKRIFDNSDLGKMKPQVETMPIEFQI